MCVEKINVYVCVGERVLVIVCECALSPSGVRNSHAPARSIAERQRERECVCVLL